MNGMQKLAPYVWVRFFKNPHTAGRYIVNESEGNVPNGVLSTYKKKPQGLGEEYIGKQWIGFREMKDKKLSRFPYTFEREGARMVTGVVPSIANPNYLVGDLGCIGLNHVALFVFGDGQRQLDMYLFAVGKENANAILELAAAGKLCLCVEREELPPEKETPTGGNQ